MDLISKKARWTPVVWPRVATHDAMYLRRQDNEFAYPACALLGHFGSCAGVDLLSARICRWLARPRSAAVKCRDFGLTTGMEGGSREAG